MFNYANRVVVLPVNERYQVNMDFKSGNWCLNVIIYIQQREDHPNETSTKILLCMIHWRIIASLENSESP